MARHGGRGRWLGMEGGADGLAWREGKMAGHGGRGDGGVSEAATQQQQQHGQTAGATQQQQIAWETGATKITRCTL